MARRRRIWSESKRPGSGSVGIAALLLAALLAVPAALLWSEDARTPSCGSHAVEAKLLDRLGDGIAAAVERVSMRSLPSGTATGQRCLGRLMAAGREHVVDFTILPADGPGGFRIVLHGENRT